MVLSFSTWSDQLMLIKWHQRVFSTVITAGNFYEGNFIFHFILKKTKTKLLLQKTFPFGILRWMGLFVFMCCSVVVHRSIWYWVELCLNTAVLPPMTRQIYWLLDTTSQINTQKSTSVFKLSFVSKLKDLLWKFCEVQNILKTFHPLLISSYLVWFKWPFMAVTFNLGNEDTMEKRLSTNPMLQKL